MKILTIPPGVNLSAFLTKFIKIYLRRVGSPTSYSGNGSSGNSASTSKTDSEYEAGKV